MRPFVCFARTLAAACLLALAACGGGGDPAPPPAYTIGGSVTGLAGSGLVLRSNAADDLAVAGSAFTFATPLPGGAAYSVTVATQPSNPAQVCSVGNASGTVGSANVTDVAVTCSAPPAPAGTRAAYVLSSEVVGEDSFTTLRSFAVNAQTGQLREFARVRPADSEGTEHVLADPLGRFIYLQGAGTDVQVFRADEATGSLVATGLQEGIEGLRTIDPQGRFAYALVRTAPQAHEIRRYTINALNGALSAAGAPLSTGAFAIDHVVFAPSGRFVYAAGTTGIATFAVDVATGGVTRVSPDIAVPDGVAALAIDPLGRFVFAAVGGNSNIETFAIDANIGALSRSAGPNTVPIRTFTKLQPMSIDPSGRFLYALILGSSEFEGKGVVGFRIDAISGALTLIDPGTPVGGDPDSIQVDPSGRFLYVPEVGEVRALAIDAQSGALSAPALTALGNEAVASSIALVPGPPLRTSVARFVYVANLNGNTVQGYAIDDASGALTSIGAAIPVGVEPTSIAVTPDGRFAYVTSRLSETIHRFTIDPASGVLTSQGVTISAGGPAAMKVHPTGRFLFVANQQAGTLDKFAIDAGSGELTRLGSPLPTDPRPNAIAFGLDGEIVFVGCTPSNRISSFRVNLSSGALLSLGETPAVLTGPLAALTQLAVDPSGRYLVVGLDFYIGAYRIDPVTGALTDTHRLDSDPIRPISGLAFHPHGAYLYESHLGDYPITPNFGYVYTRLLETPFESLLEPYAALQGPFVNLSGIVIARSGRFGYVSDSGLGGVWALRIDPATGALTTIGSMLPAGDWPKALAIVEVLQ
jgi:6-phosphogluconolactonase